MERTIAAWPNSKKLVVMVTIMFEVWSDGKAPPYSPMTTSLKPGTPDLLGISWSQYGGKTGMWRFLRILDEHDKLKIGDTLHVCGVSGEMFYLPGHSAQSLLLACWDAGLTALIGVVQDIFEFEHNGPVYLFHGVETAEHLYFQSELREISDYFPNFHYVPCVKQGTIPADGHLGEVDQIVAEKITNLAGWEVFLSGRRNQIHTVQRHAYLSGASMKDIFLEVVAI